MAGTVSRPSIVNLHTLGNFSQAFRWHVNFKALPSLLSQYDAEKINFHAESISIPTKEIETTEIQIRGNMVRQQGVGTYTSPITLTLIETVDAYCLSFLSDWQELAWSTNDTYGKTKYKNEQTATIELNLLDSEDAPYYKYTIYDCQLATGEAGNDADANTGDPFKPALGIFYDYFKREPVIQQGQFSFNPSAFGTPKGDITDEENSR